jgi:hypothetical protein
MIIYDEKLNVLNSVLKKHFFAPSKIPWEKEHLDARDFSSLEKDVTQNVLKTP